MKKQNKFNNYKRFLIERAPCHQARVCKTWLRNKQITVLEPWPGSSPDLSPIEHCWSVMKTKVAQHKPSSLSQLRQIIFRVWAEEICEEFCRDLVLSMPKRIEAVIKAKGRSTKYLKKTVLLTPNLLLMIIF